MVDRDEEYLPVITENKEFSWRDAYKEFKRKLDKNLLVPFYERIQSPNMLESLIRSDEHDHKRPNWYPSLYYHHILSSFRSNPPLLFMYCLYYLRILLFLKTASHEFFVWSLFLEVEKDENPINLAIYSADAYSSFYSSLSSLTYLAFSYLWSSAFCSCLSRVVFLLSLERDRLWDSDSELSLASTNLASLSRLCCCLSICF